MIFMLFLCKKKNPQIFFCLSTKELSKLRVSAHELLIEQSVISGPKFLVKKDFVQLVIR